MKNPTLSLHGLDIELRNTGKSTLQNELLGDPGNECGTLPDRAEDMAIQTLGECLEATFSGQLGKQSQALLLDDILQDASRIQSWGYENT